MPPEKYPWVLDRDQVNASLPLRFKYRFILPLSTLPDKVSGENSVSNYRLKILPPDKMESHVKGMDDVRWKLHERILQYPEADGFGTIDSGEI